eukprot:scaffold6832_cov210-Pinguiococcus_pyrenoidosus.AAC.2
MRVTYKIASSDAAGAWLNGVGKAPRKSSTELNDSLGATRVMLLIKAVSCPLSKSSCASSSSSTGVVGASKPG